MHLIMILLILLLFVSIFLLSRKCKLEIKSDTFEKIHPASL